MKILFLIFSAASLPITVFAGNLTNCHNDERIAFSCTSGMKVISMCAAPLKSDADYLDTVFRRMGKLLFHIVRINRMLTIFFIVQRLWVPVP